MADAGVGDKYAQVRGFKVEIDQATGKEVDTAWETCSGGELCIECADTTIGADKFQTTSPGHKSVSEIILRGAMTNKRAALCTWINDTTQGKPWKRNMTITELLSVDGGWLGQQGRDNAESARMRQTSKVRPRHQVAARHRTKGGV
jgi:hypothetical protein